jgi:predicted nucleotidyltransferase component of viral defense system
MIPRDFITQWRSVAPWVSDAQVEHDLVITRAVVAIFSDAELSRSLAFRGGTALYKLHLDPARYSEDIDLVQTRPEPIGPTFDRLHAAIDPWLGKPKWEIKEGRANLVYRFDSEDVPPLKLRLKLEINTHEHFAELGLVQMPLTMESRWSSGEANITSYQLDELLGTKMRALYQRKKGRDLFDLWYALERAETDPDRIIRCFSRYLAEGGHAVPREAFEKNLRRKLGMSSFRRDVDPLLRPDVEWDVNAAGRVVLDQLVSRLPEEEEKEA